MNRCYRLGIRLTPFPHGLLKRYRWALRIRHEVVQISFPTVRTIDLKRYKRAGELKPSHWVQRSMLVPVRRPGQDLRVGDIGLSLCNRASTNAVEHQLMHQLVGGGQLFAGWLTSLTAVMSAQPSPGSRFIASSNGKGSSPFAPNMTLADR